MPLHTYAKRQLNPFEGVLQIAETDQARAFSVNGRVWQIQVLTTPPDHTWRSLNRPESQKQFLNWGLWSNQKGLHKVNANPILDLGNMTRNSDQLVNELHKTEPPYPLTDHYEYWACDTQNQPLALLTSSACSPTQNTEPQADTWHAMPSNNWCSSNNHDEASTTILAKHIQQQSTHAAWFERLSNGDGIHLSHQQIYPAENFPACLIREQWDDPQINAAVKTYIHQIAPLLLALPLSKSNRLALESIACQQNAPLVAELFAIYPTVVDRALIEKARVETKLRNTR